MQCDNQDVIYLARNPIFMPKQSIHMFNITSLDQFWKEKRDEEKEELEEEKRRKDEFREREREIEEN